MKTLRLMIVTAVCAGVLSTAAFAQSKIYLQANVPFTFKAGLAVLPPGTYKLNTDSQGLLHITDRKTSANTIVLTRPSERGNAATCKLVFHRYGDRYFLREVWQSGESVSTFRSGEQMRMERTGARPAVASILAQAR